MSKTTIKLGIVAMATLSAVGCSSTSTAQAQSGGTHTAATGGSGTTANPCSFVTLARAGSDTGKTFSATSISSTPGQSTCTYKNSGDGDDLVITVYAANSGVTYQAMVG